MDCSSVLFTANALQLDGRDRHLLFTLGALADDNGYVETTFRALNKALGTTSTAASLGLRLKFLDRDEAFSLSHFADREFAGTIRLLEFADSKQSHLPLGGE